MLNKWYQPDGKLTLQQRWWIMRGDDVPPFWWGVRACWALFALWTMSQPPGSECYLPFWLWILAVGFYYFVL